MKRFTATRMMKNTWIDHGMPGVDIATSPQSMTSGRACTPYNEGDSATVPTSGGSDDVTVEKTTSTAAFMVQRKDSLFHCFELTGQVHGIVQSILL